MTSRFDDALRPLRATPLWTTITAAARSRRAATALEGSVEDIAAYHRARSARVVESALSDRVWSDLELDAAFARVDHCTSAIGQQVLYDLMRRPLAAPRAITERDELIRALTTEPQLRHEISSAVRGLRSLAAYDLHRLIADVLPRRPRWAVLLPVQSAIAVLAFILMFSSPPHGVLLLLAVIAVNVGVQLLYRPRVHHLIRPIGALPGLLSAAQHVAKLDAPELHGVTAGISTRCERLRWIRSLSGHLLRESSADPMAAMLTGYINLFFLADVNAFVLNIDLVRRHRDDVEALILAVGTLDALCAVAAFRAALPWWCTPQLDAAPGQLQCDGIYHPLVQNPVPNDLHVDGSSMLITGSNMAGKTTYLRAAGVCAVLGQTIATCTATKWQAPCLRVDTLIARKDDLESGKSYFLVEAELVRDLLVSAAGETPHIFIIDELYRGTNTRERVAAARAVLEQLNEGNHVCLVATHDTELIDLLRGDWEFWHFQESLDESGMHFDYRIRPGAASAGNALRVLESSGYPARVIASAYATFDELGGTSDASTREALS